MWLAGHCFHAVREDSGGWYVRPGVQNSSACVNSAGIDDQDRLDLHVAGNRKYSAHDPALSATTLHSSVKTPTLRPSFRRSNRGDELLMSLICPLSHRTAG